MAVQEYELQRITVYPECKLVLFNEVDDSEPRESEEVPRAVSHHP